MMARRWLAVAVVSRKATTQTVISSSRQFSLTRRRICALRRKRIGPVTTVIPTNSLEDAVQIANGVRYGLSAAIYTRDVNRAFKAMNEMYTGIFYVNASTIGAEVHLPFGGTKATGNGHREAGTQVLDIFSEWKSIYVDFSGKLQRAQIDQVESPQ